MAEETPPPQPPPPPTYLEVSCKSSCKIRRFASGTDAGSVVSVINRKLKRADPLALHIEAVKEGEEPIAFGPNSVLVDYGDGWKLQTFNEADAEDVKHGDQFPPMAMPRPVSGDSRPNRKLSKPVSLLYIVKILFAFIVIFVLGAIFTLFLENLPSLILYFKSLTSAF